MEAGYAPFQKKQRLFYLDSRLERNRIGRKTMSSNLFFAKSSKKYV